MVIDNNSKDNTKDIVEGRCVRPGIEIQYIREEEQGLSRVRIRGIQEDKRRIVLFTDDDCYLQPGYFREVVNTFTISEIAYCGGCILLFDKSEANSACISRRDRFSFRPAEHPQLFQRGVGDGH
jgi:glycosyltransferase involved in cell wall biosynthesis